MIKTKNDMAKALRSKMVTLLNAHLADALDLQLQTKQAHWNVKGPRFIALHEFFDKLHDVAEEFADTIAERATALAGLVEGTAAVVAKKSRLPDYPLDITDGMAHIDALSTAFAAFGKLVRAAIDTADEAGDADTADLFTGISRETDKQLWFIEAHQQADK